MNILAIDYGTKIFGIAISLFGIPMAYNSIIHKDDESTIKKIKEIIIDEKINLILLGIPLNKNGLDNERSILVKNFCNKLKMEIDLEIILINEENSTKESIDQLKNFNYNNKKIKKMKDSISALNILNRYLK